MNLTLNIAFGIALGFIILFLILWLIGIVLFLLSSAATPAPAAPIKYSV